MQLTTDRLVIREMVPSDAPFILDLVNQPAFHQNIGDKDIQSIADAEFYILTAGTETYLKLGFGMYLVVFDTKPIGICGLLKRPFLDHPDIGFAYDEGYWNRGLGTEAALAIVKHATTTLGHTRLSAFTSLDNKASGRLLEKVGFRFDGEKPLTEELGPVATYEYP